jgi:8-oxo-dGTP pyrophosphatase MutT (NUDIX family)
MEHSNLKSSVGTLFYSVGTKRYLFLLRSAKNHDSTWGFCSGKVEAKESDIQALEREIIEELGFMPNVTKHIPVERFTNLNKGFVFQTFVSIVGEEFVPVFNTENKGYAWTAIENYPKPLHPGVYNTINADEIMNKFKTVEAIWQ